MSVVAMFLVNQAMHHIVAAASGPCAVISYVDNWEVVSKSCATVERAEQALLTFVQDISVALDPSKTYYWSTNAQNRKHLRRQGATVYLDCKDLGGHMTYCKKATMHTIASRIQTSQDLWTWLARSPAPDYQKMKILWSVAWPRCLHAISSVRIGKQHVQKLRSAAMAALGWDKRGANSSLQFGICATPKADPGFYILLETVSDFREHARHCVAHPTLDKITWDPPKSLPQGPGAALLQQLHLIGWSWQGSGYVADHDAIQWNLHDEPFQWVVAKLAHAWSARTGGLMQSRAGFEGLVGVDRVTTFANWGHWSLERKGILRAAMNGTFFTNDALVHSGHVDSKSCPFCGALDGKYHRLWECPFFTRHREQIPPHMRDDILGEAPCFHTHGWVTEPVEAGLFRKALHSIPDTSALFENAIPEGTLHMFTDGACKAPRQPGARVATWAVCLANLENDTFTVFSQGGVTGGAHTALRGELTAAISAITGALHFRRRFTLWLDNQTVYDFLELCRQHGARTRSPRQKDHLLWNRLYDLMQEAKASDLIAGIVKVQSHAVINDALTPIDQWALRGNASADRAASGAFLLLPASVRHLWQRTFDALTKKAGMRDHMHQLIVNIAESTFLDTAPENVEPQCPKYTKPPPSQEARVSLWPLPTQLTPYPSFLGNDTELVMQWLGTIVNHPDAAPRWTTSYHLLALFQICTKQIGFQYMRSSTSWRRIHDTRGFDGPAFLRCCRWFQTVLKKLGEHYSLPLIREICNPESDLIACWCQCIRVPMPVAMHSALEDIMAKHVCQPVKSIRSSFAKVDEFTAEFFP